MKTTPFQIILMSVFGASAIVGVLVFAILTSTGTQSTIGPVVIWGTFDSKSISQIIQDSSNGDANLALVTYVQKDQATYEADLTRALASGNGPDLFIMSQDQAITDASEVSLIPYTEVSPSQYQNLFISATSPFMLHDGIVALPFIADPLVLFWNKDLLGSAGVTEAPKFWSQLFTTPMQSLTTKDDSGTLTQNLIALGEYGNIDHAKDILATLIMQVGGAITTRDPTTGDLTGSLGKADTSGSLEGTPAESALRFYTEFSDPSKNYYSWNRAQPLASMAFAHGTSALYIGYASEQSEIEKINPNLKFAMARIPQSGSTQGPITTARVYAIAISRNSRNIVGAKTIAYTLVSAPFSNAIANSYGMVSPRRDVLTPSTIKAAPTSVDPKVNAARAAAFASSTPDEDVITQSAIIAQGWSDPDPLKTNEIFRAMIEDTTSGAILLAEAIGRANSQLLAIIAGN
jgi:ABC-type glycerol-3-phosphate transport system substrate-binding protein